MRQENYRYSKQNILYIICITAMLILLVSNHQSWHYFLHTIDSSNNPYSYSGLAKCPILQFIVFYSFSIMCILLSCVLKPKTRVDEKIDRNSKPKNTEKKAKLYVALGIGFFAIGSYILANHWQSIQINFFDFYSKLFNYSIAHCRRHRIAPDTVAVYTIIIPILIPIGLYLRQKLSPNKD